MNIYVETERLILREILPIDVEGMFELDSNPIVHKYLGNKPVKTIEESKNKLITLETNMLIKALVVGLR